MGGGRGARKSVNRKLPDFMVDEEEAFGKGSEGVLMVKIFVFILNVLV